ncbi:MAG: hypothetical protein NT120_02355 [Candidatus Aenigmarchaeota archaeon]|nr:hypothetical protein [Candidatus Aenigmarchaeota archaeon]
MKKGIVITTNFLVTIIFIIIAALIIFMLYGSFASEAGRPASNIFYKLFDFLAGFLS